MSQTLRCLVSVRNVAEAQMVQALEMQLIDLKDTNSGALAMLDLATTQAICLALRTSATAVPKTQATPNSPHNATYQLSATVGDDSDHPHRLAIAIQRRVALGIEYIKVPISIWASANHQPVLQALIADGVAFIVVFPPNAITDQSLARTLQRLKAEGVVGVMVDTIEKQQTITRQLTHTVLEQFVNAARHCELMVGIAGGLQLSDFDALAKLQPDYLGFRSGLCHHGQRFQPLLPSLCERLRNNLFDYYQNRVKPEGIIRTAV